MTYDIKLEPYSLMYTLGMASDNNVLGQLIYKNPNLIKDMDNYS